MGVEKEFLHFLQKESEDWAKVDVPEHAYVYGTITHVKGTLVNLIRAGESAPDSQMWPTLGPWSPVEGQRVFCARADKGLVVLGPINVLLSGGGGALNYIADKITMASAPGGGGKLFDGALKFDAGRFVMVTSSGSPTITVDGDTITDGKIPFRGTFKGVPYIFTQVEKVNPNTLDGTDVPLSIVLVPKTSVYLDGFIPIYVTDTGIINETITVAWMAVGV